MTEANNAQAGQQQQIEVRVREEKAQTYYSNVVRVGGTAEELIVDFAINHQDPENPGVLMMDINAKIVMNLYAAKRLTLALSQTVQRYEQQFGPIELDVRKRLRQG
ncbi:MAG: DUF3467 domain-containing protein [Phycisphaerae bacterium]